MTEENESNLETLSRDIERVAKEPATTAAMVPVTAGGIAIQNLDELMKFARLLVKDGAAPKRWTPGQVAIAIQSGMQAGLGLMGGIQQGAVINGIFSWRGQAAVALIQNSGKCKPGTLFFGCRGEGDSREGYAKAWRVGYASEEERTFSVAEAKRAGLWTKEGPWREYPERQLAWRALSFLARDVFPDVLGGFPLAEEAADYKDLSEKPKQQPPELPAAPLHDPLMDALEGRKPEPEVVDAELVSEIDEAIAAVEMCEHGIADGCIMCGPEEEGL